MKALLALSVLLFIIPNVASEAEESPWQVVAQDSTWEGEQTLERPVLVPAGVTLTIRDAQVRFAASTSCFVGGNVAQVCVRDIHVQGTLVIQDSDVAGADTAHGSKSWFIEGTGGTLHIRDSTFRDGHIRFEWSGPAVSTIERSAWYGGHTALEFNRGAQVTVTGSLFDGVDFPIFMKDNKATVAGNTFRDSVRASELHATHVGEKFPWEIDYDLRDNLFQDNVVGVVHLGNLASQIHANQFDGNRYGLMTSQVEGTDAARTDVPRVDGNTFAGNEVAWTVAENSGFADGARAWTIPARDNLFLDNCHHVVVHEHATGVTVDARGNWWGSAAGPQDGPGCPATIGDVLVAPWLEAAP